MTSVPDKIIDIRSALPHPILRGFYRMVEWPVEQTLSIKAFNHYYTRVRQSPESKSNFFRCALDVLGAHYGITEEALAQIPETGPLITVSNHPFGFLDGLLLGAILTSVRQDVKLMLNYWLCRMGELSRWSIPVNSFGGAQAIQANKRVLHSAFRFVKSGGALGLFPAGEVSHLRCKPFKVTDSAWHIGLGNFIRRTGATVVPIYFAGRNSSLFQAVGLLHPLMRTLLLARELCKKLPDTFTVHIGHRISPERLNQFQDTQELMDFLRLKTYILKTTALPEGRPPRALNKTIPKPFARSHATQEPLIEPIPKTTLLTELDALPESARLLQQGNYTVYLAESQAIPQVLREIGRLREASFREVGEGTGLSYDLDRFDSYYQHLFLWNKADQDIVGAYRIGPVDRILETYGAKGLYTRTLFRFKSPLLEKLKYALEMGRSFVVSKYQRKHTSLSLIWRGIGEYIARHRDYAILFGPVSISSAYQPISRELIVDFLRENNLDPEIASLVKAKRPPRTRKSQSLHAAGDELPLPEIEDLSALISEIETDNKGVPLLLRYYLRLNGVLLSFNVDRRFAHCIDGLILVDLRKSDPKILKLYMGEANARHFLSYHGMAST